MLALVKFIKSHHEATWIRSLWPGTQNQSPWEGRQLQAEPLVGGNDRAILSLNTCHIRGSASFWRCRQEWP